MPADPRHAVYMQPVALRWQSAHASRRRDKFQRDGREVEPMATESDQTLVLSISEMELGEPDDAPPNPLKLRLGEYA